MTTMATTTTALDADLDADLHDAFRLMYDGIDLGFALDAAYAEEDEELPLDSVAPDLDEAALPMKERSRAKAVLPRSRIRSVLDAALDLVEAHRRPTYGYKKARIEDAYRRGRTNEVLGELQKGKKRKAGEAVLQEVNQPRSTGDSASQVALGKLRLLLNKRRGLPGADAAQARPHTISPSRLQSPSTPPKTSRPYAPFSIEAYRARLDTFFARSWTTKYKVSKSVAVPGSDAETDPLRAAEAARYGWTSVPPTSAGRANVLRCACCGVQWAVGCNAGELGGLKQEWVDKLVIKTAEQYVLAHKATCPWRRLPSPANIFDKLLPTYHPLLSSRLAAIAQDIDQQCLSLASSGVQVVSPLTEQEIFNLQNNLAKSLKDVDADASHRPEGSAGANDSTYPASTDQADSPAAAISRKSALFAFFGWAPSNKGTGSSPAQTSILLNESLSCKLCNGGRFLRADLRGQTGPLDLVRRHSDHCPVVATQATDPATARKVAWWHDHPLLQDSTWASKESEAERLKRKVEVGLNSL